MNPLLEKLGVSSELQAFFKSTDCVFDFGDSFEHFGPGFHKVPTTQNVWRTAGETVTNVIISHSAMECLAYLTLNRHRFQLLSALGCVALGNYPYELQLEWVRRTFYRRKFTLVFSNDLVGRVMDIKVMTGLRNKPTRLWLSGDSVIARYHERTLSFAQANLSLHSFEKAFSIRSGIRTRKPLHHLTFLDELTYDHK